MTAKGHVPLPQGIPRLDGYRSLLESEAFRRMESFSDSFLKRHRGTLAGYGRRWVPDPLHQWSRQWEYPFVYEAVGDAAAGGKELRILDAGSGITFFPWYLGSELPGARVTCCDRDASLEPLFAAVNGGAGEVRFIRRDLAETGIADGSMDVVYSISVLEHTERMEAVIGELARVLRPGGILAVTFDISLDGLGEISLRNMGGLMAALEHYFPAPDGESPAGLLDEQLRDRADRVTTAGPWGKGLLPWRYPLLSTLKAALSRGRIPSRAVREFTFSCHVFRKAGLSEGRP